ncbi:CBS-domain-containing protein, partial [Clavulina sp. PMI_390]
PQASPRATRRGSTKPPGGGRNRGHSTAGQLPEQHDRALKAVRNFLHARTSYDVFPVSFRIIILDNKLEIKKALHVLLANSVVSAPLWDGDNARFAGMFTVQDIIHLIQYYYLHSGDTSLEEVTQDVEQFQLLSLRDIERELNVPTPPLISISPLQSLWKACELLIGTHARRLPLIEEQPTGEEVILSVLTQYRALKAISTNVKEIRHLKRSLRSLGIGTYINPTADNPFAPIYTAQLNTTVFEVVHLFSEKGISAVPIIDSEGIVINLYETVDVITLVRLGAYQSLDLTISAALKQRPADFPGVITCTPGDSLASLLLLIQQRRVHRLVVVEGAEGRKGRLVGIITLSDILRYLIGD